MGNIAQEHAPTQGGHANTLSANRRRRNQREQFLTLPGPTKLEAVWREWDDKPESITIPGFPRDVIETACYKYPLGGCVDPIKIPRRQVVVAVKNIAGRITGLHNSQNEWYTARQPHFINLTRATFTGQIEVFSTTIEADCNAIQRNVACAALNGCTIDDLKLATSHLSARLITVQALEVAA